MDENTSNINIPLSNEQTILKTGSNTSNDSKKQCLISKSSQIDTRLQKFNALLQKINELQTQNEDYKDIIEQQDAEMTIIQENHKIDLQRNILITLKKCQIVFDQFLKKYQDFDSQHQDKLNLMFSRISAMQQKLNIIKTENSSTNQNRQIKEQELTKTGNQIVIKEIIPEDAKEQESIPQNSNQSENHSKNEEIILKQELQTLKNENEFLKASLSQQIQELNKNLQNKQVKASNNQKDTPLMNKILSLEKKIFFVLILVLIMNAFYLFGMK